MPTINYNAALPAFSSISGRSSIDLNKWISELKGNITQLIKSLFNDGTQGIYLNAQDAVSVSDLSSIKDLSGRNNHAAQPNATSRATIITDPSGYKSLKFDGVDDGYVTPSINFTNTDKVTVIAAVRKLSTVAGVIYELSANVSTNNGSFYLASPAGQTNPNQVTFANKGTAFGSAENPNLAPPLSLVITCKGSISSDTTYMKTNNTVASSASDLGTGNYGNHPLYIGRRAGTSLPFNGQIYALLVIGKLLDAATTAKIEKEFAKYIGVTL